MGYDLILTARRANRLEQLAEQIRSEHNVEVQTLIFDVRDESACEEHLAQISTERAIDVLVNNAGLAAGLEHIDAGATEDWNAMIDTNI